MFEPFVMFQVERSDMFAQILFRFACGVKMRHVCVPYTFIQDAMGEVIDTQS